MCLDKVSYLCTMILNYSNYGTRQETINLYYQGGCQNSSLSVSRKIIVWQTIEVFTSVSAKKE